VWEFWNPRGDGSCEATTPNMTTLHDFHGWHNLRGVEIETGKFLKNMILFVGQNQIRFFVVNI